MKRSTVLFLVVALALAGCGDKLLAAKTAVAFITIGVDTAKSVIDKVVADKRVACEKKCSGAPDAKTCETKCFAETQKMVDVTGKIWPQLDKTFDLIASALKENRDVVALIKKSACLLTDLAGWIPEKHRKSIDKWIILASAFTCDKAATRIPLEHQRRIAVQLRALLVELGAKG